MKLQMHNPTLLERVFRRSENPTLAKVHSHALRQPLLVHPVIGEELLGAFLHGAVDTPPAIRMAGNDEEGAPTPDLPVGVDPAKVAILCISGALVNRPMPGLCGPGPISYVAIRNAFDDAIADSNVEAIILRIESPGGMASGCFDLADHIYASRGVKPIIAMVDDYAYSAAFAIAAACDTIWVTRTGGVGSVGVVGFHYDWSAANAKDGVAVTPIYSGARKIDFNPNFPLSPEAREQAQMVSDAMYAMFVNAVATYRGMTPDVVRATEAGTFVGQASVDAGFADRMGTMRDLLADLADPQPAPEPAPEPDAVEPPAEEEPAPTDDLASPPAGPMEPAAAAPVAQVDLSEADRLDLVRGQLARVMAGASLPAEVSMALLEMETLPAGRTPEQLVADAAKIVDLCTAAGLPELAADTVKSGVTVDQARKSLLAAKADTGPQLVTALPVAGVSGNQAAAGHWGETIKRFGG